MQRTAKMKQKHNSQHALTSLTSYAHFKHHTASSPPARGVTACTLRHSKSRGKQPLTTILHAGLPGRHRVVRAQCLLRRLSQLFRLAALCGRGHTLYPSPTKTQGGVRRTWPPHFILAMASPRAADSTVPVTERSLFRIFYNKHLQTRLHYRLFVCLPTKDTMEGLTTFSKHDDRKDACCPANSISFCLSPSPMYLFVLAILSELNPTDLAEMRAGPTNV